MKSRILAAVIAVILTAISFAAVVPAFAEEGDDITVPAAFDPHDYLKVRAILETEDENGVKNGTKINENYDPDRPGTWYGIDGSGAYGVWFEMTDGLYHITYFFPKADMDLCGELDLSDCSKLIQIFSINSHYTSVNAQNCPELLSVDVRNDNGDGAVTSIDLSNCPRLETLICSGNPVESVDLTGCGSLVNVDYEILVLAGLAPEEVPADSPEDDPDVPATGGMSVAVFGAALVALGAAAPAARRGKGN